MPSQKLILYIARQTNDSAELLVCRAMSDVEAPCAVLSSDEQPDVAWKRVAHDYTGIGEGARIKKRLGKTMIAVPTGIDGKGPVETQIIHGLLIDPGKGVPANWTHKRPDGSDVVCSWIPVTGGIGSELKNNTHLFASQVLAALDIDDE